MTKINGMLRSIVLDILTIFLLFVFIYYATKLSFVLFVFLTNTVLTLLFYYTQMKDRRIHYILGKSKWECLYDYMYVHGSIVLAVFTIGFICLVFVNGIESGPLLVFLLVIDFLFLLNSYCLSRLLWRWL